MNKKLLDRSVCAFYSVPKLFVTGKKTFVTVPQQGFI